MFLSRKFANTRSTKALRGYFALPESPPTSATLLPRRNYTMVSEEDATGSGKKEDMMAIWEVIANWSVKNRKGGYGDFDSWAWQVKRWKYH